MPKKSDSIRVEAKRLASVNATNPKRAIVKKLNIKNIYVFIV